MALVPCDSCRRHVRAGESACPFCKAVRNASTAAVVVVSALALAGCDAVSPASKYGGPPPEYPTAQPEAPDAAPPPAPSTTASSPRVTEPEVPKQPTAPVAMYGAPPRR